MLIVINIKIIKGKQKEQRKPAMNTLSVNAVHDKETAFLELYKLCILKGLRIIEI